MKKIVVYDPALEDVDILIDSVTSQTNVIKIESKHRFIEFIKDLRNLQTSSESLTVDILCHGNSGRLKFGNEQIDVADIERIGKNPKLDRKSNYVINLWSCDVAKGEIGMAFIKKLTMITGAKVNASSNKVGSPSDGGNWNLDVSYALPPFAPQALSSWNHTLGTAYTVSEFLTAIDLKSGGDPALNADVTGNATAVLSGLDLSHGPDIASVHITDATVSQAVQLRDFVSAMNEVGLTFTFALDTSAGYLDNLSVEEAQFILESGATGTAVMTSPTSVSASNITIRDEFENLEDNLALFQSSGILEFVTNVSVVDVYPNELVKLQASDYDFVDAIELDVTDFNYTTSSLLVDEAKAIAEDTIRLTNEPAISTILINDTAANFIASKSDFESGGSLATVSADKISLTDATVLEFNSLLASGTVGSVDSIHSKILSITISDTFANLGLNGGANVDYSTGGSSSTLLQMLAIDTATDTIPKLSGISVQDISASNYSTYDSFVQPSDPSARSFSLKDTPNNLVGMGGDLDAAKVIFASAVNVEISSGTSSALTLAEMAALSEVMETIPDAFTISVSDTAKNITDFYIGTEFQVLAVGDADVLTVVSDNAAPITLSDYATLKTIDDIVIPDSTVHISDIYTNISNSTLLNESALGEVTVSTTPLNAEQAVVINELSKNVAYNVQMTCRIF